MDSRKYPVCKRFGKKSSGVISDEQLYTMINTNTDTYVYAQKFSFSKICVKKLENWDVSIAPYTYKYLYRTCIIVLKLCNVHNKASKFFCDMMVSKYPSIQQDPICHQI